MNALKKLDDEQIHKIMQAIKWTVYTFLILNFFYYVWEDWTRAAHILREGAPLLDWTNEFATTIDELGWFALLAMFELETYVLSDDTMRSRTGHIVRGVRLVCYVMLAHTIYAYTVSLADIRPQVPVEDVTDLCQLAGEDISFVRNLEYTYIDESTCSSLSGDSRFFWVSDDPIVSDEAGLALEQQLALVDVIEASTWLLVLAAIEMVVRLQGRGITGGPAVRTGNLLKVVFYSTILGAGIYWAYLGHWVYLWDEIVWIGGFAAIEMNISEWRDELREQQGQPVMVT